MIHCLLKDNIRFVEQVDKLVDPSGNVAELIEEIVSNLDALPGCKTVVVR